MEWLKAAIVSIPPLDVDGYLPEGIHNCTLNELQSRFGEDIDVACRSLLCSKLCEYVQELRSTERDFVLLVDGSFVTSKAQPNDIDLILILPHDHDFRMELRPFEYNAMSRRRVSKRYGLDLLVARDDSPELREYVEFFQQVRGDPSRRKGILRVQS